MLLEAYVDGSWMDDRVGWACVIVKDGAVHDELSGVVDDAEVLGTRQVAGELRAVEELLLWCKKHKIKEIKVHYDYTGLEEWASGRWKAKNPVTKRYKENVAASDVKIHWIKVKSHSGVKYNEIVDKLAKKAINGY